MTSIKVTNIPVQPLFLGFPGENDSRPVYVDVSPWLEEFPDATVSIVYTRSDGLTYAVVVNQTGPVVTWKPMEADLVGGKCSLQIQIKQGDAVKKDRVVDCVVGKSLDDPSDPPQEPRPTYVEEVIDAADRAEAAVTHYPQIRNDYWWVWDAESGKWVNTGVKATGEGGGSATVVVTINDTTDPMTASMTAAEIKAAVDRGERVVARYSGVDVPYIGYVNNTSIFAALVDFGDMPTTATIMVSANGLASINSTPLAAYDDIPTIPTSQEIAGLAPVQSVNGQTGAVTLTASDVNALPDSTVIPTVPQMATDPDMTDWESGKTVDAAVLATDMDLVSRALMAKYTKPSGGIPASDLASAVQTSLGKADTALQQHQSLTGYATESYVQTQIAAIPDELPAVTATDNGKFLRVVNGAWAAQAVPDAESNSFGGGA